MNRRRRVNTETIRKQIVKATLALRKSAIIAGQQGWITREQSLSLSDHILQIEQKFQAGLPAPAEPESESGAELPF
jgi:hypothetical protein